MKNKFEDIMSQHSDEELIKILNSKEGDFQPEAIEAALKEAKKRNVDSNANPEKNEQQIAIVEAKKKSKKISCTHIYFNRV